MYDIAVNLVASVVTGAAVWLFQFALRRRHLSLKRTFFGVRPGAEIVMVVPRHFSSPLAHSVHRTDVGALVELGALLSTVGARLTTYSPDEVPPGLGRTSEYCVGGWTANARTATHLSALLPGIGAATDKESRSTAFAVDGTDYRADPEQVEYALVARLPTVGGHALFLVVGQTSRGNLAAARYLADRWRHLRRSHRSGEFCLVLRIRQPKQYGTDRVDVAADVTSTAFTAVSVADAVPAAADGQVARRAA